MKKIYLLMTILIAVAVAAAVWLVPKYLAPNGSTDKSNLIQVAEPVSGALITSPVMIRGKARGFWFFEASFPAKLLDGNGKEIAIIPVQATDEWMTENFVPFSTELKFVAPQTNTGTLVLEKDNPSGLPEYDDQLRIPVRFR